MESIEASGITGTLRGISYCQSRNVQFGSYIEFDHEPTARDVANAVSLILNQILDSVVIRKLDETKVILKTPDDFKNKNRIEDPLNDVEADWRDRWTVGVKISCKDAMYEYPCKFNLHAGVAPDPMEI